jgi:hypothetical protein
LIEPATFANKQREVMADSIMPPNIKPRRHNPHHNNAHSIKIAQARDANDRQTRELLFLAGVAPGLLD